MKFISTKTAKILLVLLVVLAFAIYFGRLNVFDKKEDSIIQQSTKESEVLFTPLPSPTPKPTLTPIPTPSPSLEQTPTGDSSVSVRASPTPSKPPIFSTQVALGRASSAVPDQAQGSMDIQVTNVAPHSSGLEGYKVVSYKYQIVLENMEGDKEYWISFCYQDEGYCTEFVLVKTDASGNMSSAGERSKSYDINRPYWYIKVTQADTSGQCSSHYSPCLRGNFSLSL